MAKKILVIEDSPGIRLSLQLAFEAAGFEVATAADGQEGFELAKAHPADLIVLDLFLPEMDGFKVLEFLRSNRSTEKVPIVIFSALASEADKAEAFRLGASDYIVKSDMSINEAVSRAVRHMR